MHQFLALILTASTFLSFSSQTAFASENANTHIAELKLQIENLPSGTRVAVKLTHHRKIEGQLMAPSEEGFQIDTPEPTDVSYNEVKSIERIDGQGGTNDPVGQATPPNQPAPPAPHHRHFLRKALIAVAVVFALTVLLVATNKS